jgi:hypothetical protein
MVLLTKVTPGIGLLWFAARREWRAVAIAAGATAAVCLTSFAVTPQLWIAWLNLMASTDPAPLHGWVWIDAPLSWRLGLAAPLVVLGALRGLRWTVFAAAFLALPAVWVTSEVILLAALSRQLGR